MSVRLSRNAFWTDFDKDLIAYAKDHPIIYDVNITHWNDIPRAPAIKMLWEKFAKNKNKPVVYCTRRWRGISEFYKNKLLKFNSKIDRSTWNYSKYLDGRLAFLGTHPRTLLANEDNIEEKQETPPENAASCGEQQSTSAVSKRIKAKKKQDEKKITVVTQDMIEKLLKSKEEGKKQNSVKSNETLASMLTSPSIVLVPIVQTVPQNNIILNAQSNVFKQSHVFQNDIVPQSVANEMTETSCELSVKVECEEIDEGNDTDVEILDDVQTSHEGQINNNFSEGSAYGIKISGDPISVCGNSSNTSQVESVLKRKIEESEDIQESGTKRMKGILNHHRMSTIDFFDELGEYVSEHFPEEMHRELRLMMWSLITNEELEMLQEESASKFIGLV